jgi:hypothetical protein|tara:strand:+ start:152 stop:379 length:228 start_codon:yes stop_codon:yes gene_type:complete
MSHYDDQRERYEEEQELLALKRSRLRAMGYDPYKMEQEDKAYKNSKRVLESVPHHQEKVRKYESSASLKWDEFNV